MGRTQILTRTFVFAIFLTLGLFASPLPSYGQYYGPFWSNPARNSGGWWDYWSHFHGTTNQGDVSNWGTSATANGNASFLTNGQTVNFTAAGGSTTQSISISGGNTPARHGSDCVYTATVIRSGYSNTVVADMYVTGGNYHFYTGNISTNTNGEAINPDTGTPNWHTTLGTSPVATVGQAAILYGRETLQSGGGYSSGALYISGGNTNFYLETDFIGGTVFSGGTVSLMQWNSTTKHSQAFGIWQPGSSAADINSDNTKKDPKRGLVHVLRDSEVRVDIGGSGVSNERVFQNRYFVDKNSTLSFGVPYQATSDMNVLPVLTLGDVDTSYYNEYNGASPYVLNGGAIYLEEGADLGRYITFGGQQGELAFKNNKAVRGAAIYATNNLTITGNTRFSGNQAVNNTTTSTRSINAYGGAIYMLGQGTVGNNTLTLRANSTTGDILFENNSQTVATDPGNTTFDNAVFLANRTHVLLEGDRYVYFDDSINVGAAGADSSSANSMTVDMPGTATNAGGGFIQFSGGGTSLLNPSGTAGGRVDIVNGQFRIVNGTKFGTQGSNAEFIVRAGGTLGGNGTIQAEQGFQIFGTISADDWLYTMPAQLSGTRPLEPMRTDNLIGTLNLQGKTLFNDSTWLMNNSTTTDVGSVYKSDRIAVTRGEGSDENNGKILLTPGTGRSTVEISTWAEGTYVIGTSSVGIFNDTGKDNVTNDNIMEYFNPVVLSSTNSGGVKMDGRKGASLKIDYNLLGGAEHDIVLETSDNANLYLVWTGETNSRWENSGLASAVKNWRSTRTSDTSQFETYPQVLSMERMNFQNGDYVFFNAIGQEKSPIMIESAGIEVSGMEVIGGAEYRFNGQPIVGVDDQTVGVTATGKLRIAGQSADGTSTKVTFNTSTDFINGTELSDGVTVVLMNNNALGAYTDSATKTTGIVKLTPYIDYNGASSGNGNGTISTGINNLTIVNRFEVTENSTLTFDIGNNQSLVINNVIVGAGSGRKGGAIFLDVNADIARTGTGLLTIQKSSTSNQGGGIYASKSLTITGNTVFKDNTASTNAGYTQGDDIYMAGEAPGILTLNADVADIVFIKSAATVNRTSVLMNNGVEMKIQGNNNVFFDGSVRAVDDVSLGNNNLTIEAGTGIVQFRGDNLINPANNGGTVSIGAGRTVRLTAATDSANGLGLFETKGYDAAINFASGSTVQGNGIFSIERTNGIANFNLAGVTVSPDSDVLYSALGRTDYTSHLIVGENSEAAKIGIMYFNTDGLAANNRSSVYLDGTTFNIDVGLGDKYADYVAGDPTKIGQSDKIYVNGVFSQVVKNSISTINISTLKGVTAEGDYLLMSGSPFVGVTDTDQAADWFTPLTATLREAGNFQFKESVVGSNVFDQLWLIDFAGGKNLKIYWTGSDGMTWDERGLESWVTNKDGNYVVTDFYSNDYIYFDSTITPTVTQGEITLADNMSVSGMEVLAGTYTITGAGKTITGVKTANSADITATGKLVVGGTATDGTTQNAVLKLATGTNFVEGIELKTNGTIVVADNNALGNYNHANYMDAVNNVNPATASKQGYVNAAGGKISTESGGARAVKSRINVANNATLEFNTGSILRIGGTGGVGTGNDVTTAPGQNDGAALIAGQGSTINKTGASELIFNGNTAVNGGAIAAGGNVNINANQGRISFSNNTATTNGSAISSTGSLTVSGDVKFIDNTAAAGSGAVHMNGGNLTLNASNAAGKTTIGFDDNTPNDVYLNGANLIAQGAGDIYFGTGVGSNGTSNMTVSMTKTASDPGRVVFDSRDANNTISGNLTVTSGEVAIGPGSTLNVAGTSTIAGMLSGSGTLDCNTINVTGTLSADSFTYSYDKVNNLVSRAGTDIGTLTLDGNANLDGATLLVDLGTTGTPGISDYINVTGAVTAGAKSKVTVGKTDGTSFQNGEYNILTNAANVLDLADFYVDPKNYGDRNTATLDLSADGKTLILKTESDGIAVLYWTGKDDLVWYGGLGNSTKMDWRTELTAAGQENYFIDGDEVIFADSTQYVGNRKTVTLGSGSYSDVVVSNMTVSGTNYIFNEGTGTKISGTNTANMTVTGSATVNVAVDFDNDLNANGSTANITFNKATKFDNNAEVKNGAKATFNGVLTTTNLNIDSAEANLNAANTINGNTNLAGTAKAILGNDQGFGANAVNVTANANATVTSNGTNRTVANTVNVGSNASLTYETNGFNMTFSDSTNLADGAELIANTINATDKITFNGNVAAQVATAGGFTKNGAGTVIFNGMGNRLDDHITVNNGVMQVSTGAYVYTNGIVSVKDGATLSGGGRVMGATIDLTQGTISAGDVAGQVGQIDLEGNVVWNNTTLVVDLGTAPVADMINVTGSVSINNSQGNNIVALDPSQWNAGTYEIAKATGGFDKNRGADIQSYFDIKDRDGNDLSDRQKGVVDLKLGDDNTLVLTLEQMQNLVLVWTGPNSGNWKSNDKDWTIDGTTTKDTFENGDYVIFRDNAGGSPVNVNQDVAVGGMDIQGGTYTFNGSKVSSTTNSSYAGSDQKLKIGGNADITINNEMDFENGTQFVGDATVTVGNNKAFGSTGTDPNRGVVTVDNGANALVQTNGNQDASLNNRFDVNGDLTLKSNGNKNFTLANANGPIANLANGSSLTVDGTGSTIFNGTVAGSGGDFVKDGTGTMYVNGNWNTNGTATINDGGLQVAGGINMSVTDFSLEQAATLTGTGTITSSNNNIVLAGKVAPGTAADKFGTLNLDGDTLVKTDAVLSFDLRDNNSGDKINIDGDVRFENGYVISIDDWKKGQHDIIFADGMTNWAGYVLQYADGTPVDNTGRRKTEVMHREEAGEEIVYLIASGENADLIWNGSTGKMTWNDNTGNKNWTNNGKDDYFMDDDAVTFTKKGAGTVTIADPVTVSDMTVNSGEYVFTGAGITGDAGDTSLTGKEGKLKLNGGSNTTFDTTADFKGGIDISGAGTQVSTTKNGQLKTDGILNVGAGTTLDIDPVTGSIIADELKLDGTITAKRTNESVTDVLQVEKALTADQMKKLSNSLDYSYGLVEREAQFHDGNKFMDLIYETLTVTDFAGKNGLQWNETEASKGLDSAFANGDFDELKDYMYGLESAEQVEAVIDQMRGSELYANAQMLSMWRPWKKVFGQLYDSCCCPVFQDCPEENRGGTTLGQPQQLRGYSVWVDIYHQYTDLNSDTNARDARMNRTGTLVGLDAPIGYFSKLGIVLGGSNPYVKNKFGKVESDEFTVGLYSKSHFGDSSYLLGFLGYSRDDIEASRYCLGEAYQADANGDALYFSAEYVRPVCRQNLVLFPMIALDYQQSWVGNFKESGGYYAQKTDNKSFGQLHARIGLDSKIYTSSRTNINTRLQYGYLMAGHTYAQTNATFVNSPKSGPMTMRSTKVGRSYMDIGIGGEIYLGSAKRVRLFGDYDFEYTGNYRGHTGQFGGAVNW